MARLTIRELKKRAEAIEARAMAEMDALADQWRSEVLIPWCRKNRVTILIGNGDWYFSDLKGESLNRWERRFKTIEDVLSLPGIGHEDLFGYHVESVYKSDIA